MDTAIKNTIKEIEDMIKEGRKSVKEIASNCEYFAKQCGDDLASEMFIQLSCRKRRSDMIKLISSFSYADN